MAMDDEVNGAAAAENDILGEELQRDDDVIEQHHDEDDQRVTANDVNDNVPAIDNVIENDGVDDEIVEPPERAAYGYSLRSALREARLGRDSHRNRYEREFQYMQASVKEIRKELGEKKQTKLNVSDDFSNIVNVTMIQIAKDNEYEQILYKKGKRNYGSTAVKMVLQEWAQLGEGVKRTLFQY